MKFFILACFVAVCAADSYSAPRPDSSEEIKIIRDDRVTGDDGSYSFDVETADGMYRSESGSKLDIEGNPIGSQGSVSFTFPNGEKFDLKFVANENGYQPESSWIPVAPEFPHPIPQFVLDQIAFARSQKSSEETYAPPKTTYG